MFRYLISFWMAHQNEESFVIGDVWSEFKVGAHISIQYMIEVDCIVGNHFIHDVL